MDLPPSTNAVAPSARFPGCGALRRSLVYFTVPAGLDGKTVGPQGKAGPMARALLGVKHLFEMRVRRTAVEEPVAGA